LREETGLEGRFASILYVSEFLQEGRHTVDVTARVEALNGEARLGSDPEAEEGSEPTLKEVRWVDTEELKEIQLLPAPTRKRIMSDAAQGWPSGEVYLGSGTDD
jgi:8-oxo-dGTP diphosphatase